MSCQAITVRPISLLQSSHCLHQQSAVHARPSQLWKSGLNGHHNLLADSGLPTAAAVFAIEQEWAATLADLVERRLML
ncbi:MAG: hypothetical protein EBZ13_01425, partial [Planctomycetia bacterium]|nr:hypothetical protein [Planctomycetia bacterium]